MVGPTQFLWIDSTVSMVVTCAPNATGGAVRDEKLASLPSVSRSVESDDILESEEENELGESLAAEDEGEDDAASAGMATVGGSVGLMTTDLVGVATG
ncbi:hypothetical protein PRIC2_004138 [Phytophthora ramorum]